MKKKDIILELENILGFTDALENKKEISDERKFLILQLCIRTYISKIIKELEGENNENKSKSIKQRNKRMN